MIFCIVNKENIDQINSELKNKSIPCRQTNSGDWVVTADLLEDEKNWAEAHDYLSTCEQIELTINDFPKPNI